MVRWVLGRDRSERFPSWHGLLEIDGDRSILVTRAKIVRNAGVLHPQTDKLGDILMSFFFERGDEIVEIEAAALTGRKHVAGRIAKRFPPITVLKGVEEKEAFCAENGIRLRFARPRAGSALRNHTQGAANCLRAGSGTFDGFLSQRGSKSRKSRERRKLFVKTGILAVAEPTGGERGSSRGQLGHSAAEINQQGVQRGEFGGRGGGLRAEKIRVRRFRGCKTARNHGTFHNPERFGLFATSAEAGVVSLHGTGERIGGLMQGCRVFLRTRPEKNLGA